MGLRAPDDHDHDDLDELTALTTTAGARVVDRHVQRRRPPDSRTYIGKGKLDDVKLSVEMNEAELVVFDDDLSPAQNRNVEEHVGVRVIDRSMLILDIFARHARTHEAKLQVELAQLQYLLPRLTRMWSHLGRTGGGIGTRGPGETQLEVDRRRISTKVSQLKAKLARIETERETQRSGRVGLFQVALVGYTNAGKSTLFNALAKADVLVEDKLFATLDTTTRKVWLGEGAQALLSDTVGFIRKLPHHLVASFRSTLGEVTRADLLLHVVDASSPDLPLHIEAVDGVLDQILGRDIPRQLVLNKMDRVTDDPDRAALRARYPDAWTTSARDRNEVDRVRALLAGVSGGSLTPDGAVASVRPQSAGDE